MILTRDHLRWNDHGNCMKPFPTLPTIAKTFWRPIARMPILPGSRRRRLRSSAGSAACSWRRLPGTAMTVSVRSVVAAGPGIVPSPPGEPSTVFSARLITSVPLTGTARWGNRSVRLMKAFACWPEGLPYSHIFFLSCFLPFVR